MCFHSLDLILCKKWGHNPNCSENEKSDSIVCFFYEDYKWVHSLMITNMSTALGTPRTVSFDFNNIMK